MFSAQKVPAELILFSGGVFEQGCREWEPYGDMAASAELGGILPYQEEVLLKYTMKSS
jgi:hypothetical protein